MHLLLNVIPDSSDAPTASFDPRPLNTRRPITASSEPRKPPTPRPALSSAPFQSASPRSGPADRLPFSQGNGPPAFRAGLAPPPSLPFLVHYYPSQWRGRRHCSVSILVDLRCWCWLHEVPCCVRSVGDKVMDTCSCPLSRPLWSDSRCGIGMTSGRAILSQCISSPVMQSPSQAGCLTGIISNVKTFVVELPAVVLLLRNK